MKENQGYDLFETLSKIALVVPLLLVALVVMVRWGSWGSKPVEKSYVTGVAKLSPTPPSLNLTGPYVCGTTLKIGTVSAIIQDRNIIATISASKSASYFLAQGDCIYSWNNTEAAGKKMCGVGNLLVMADSLVSRGLVSFDSLLSMAGISQVPVTAEDISQAVQSCRKQGKVPQNTFAVPKAIRFTEKK